MMVNDSLGAIMRFLLITVAVLAVTAGLIAGDDKSAGALRELSALEQQFFAGWQQKQLKPFEDNIADDGLAWGEYGIFDKRTQLKLQAGAEVNCEVRSFKLRDFRLVWVSKDAALLFYTADQDARCGGAPVPTPMTCSSIWTRRKGRWLNVYRSGVPVKSLPK